VFVDYQTVDNTGNTGPWTAATLTNPDVSAPGTLSDVRNGRGFYVKGTPTADFSSTVTVYLSGVVPTGTKFNWCAYASDYPPNATENNDYYDLHGSPPFVINGNITEASKTYSGGCIEQLTDATGCPGFLPAPPVVTAFTPLDTAICAGQSVTLTATAASATAYSFDGGISWIPGTTAASTVVTPTQDTTCTVWVRNIAGCEIPYGTAASVTIHPAATASFSTAPSMACPGSSVTVVAGGGTEYCFTHVCSNCLHNPYSTGNDIATEVDCDMSNRSCTFLPSNNYTFTMPDAGSVTVWVRALNEYGCVDSTSITIGSAAPPTITLMTGNDSQTVVEGTAIGTILYTTTDATYATATGLPSGVSGVWSNHTFTISGTPAIGTYPYTVTTTNDDGCPNAAATGTITANMITPPYAGTKTYTTCGQIWSEPVRIPACDKPTFDGSGNSAACRGFSINDTT
jgi:hypothetical protein